MRRLAVAVSAVIILLFWLGFLSSAVAQSTSSKRDDKSAQSPGSQQKSTATKSAITKRTPARSKTVASTRTKKKRKTISPRVRRVRQAFVASASLRPMAQQLLQDRTPTAYAGVEAYARRHAKEDAGALAWLVLGYAHTLDHDYARAIEPLNRAKAGAGELGDYVAYYLERCLPEHWAQCRDTGNARRFQQELSRLAPDS